MKTFVHVLTAVSLAAMLFGGAAACKSNSAKCGKAADKVMKLTKQMAKSWGANAKTGDMNKHMAKVRASFVKRCKAEVKKNPKKAGKMLDCIIAANKMADLQKCKAAASM